MRSRRPPMHWRNSLTRRLSGLALSPRKNAIGKSWKGHAIANDVDFCSVLLEATGVAVVPGSAFGEPRAIRISYTCKPAELTEGLRRIQQFFGELA